MKKYYSKISWVIFLPIYGLLVTLAVFLIIQKAWSAVLIIFIVLSFITLIIKSTHYTVDKNLLIIKSAFIINKKIDIQTITKVTPTYNPIASPALSIRRLEIHYGDHGFILISPVSKEEFLNELLKVNPRIQIAG
ncbi:MAG: PH domain-containing protein [Sphingobacteriales bacterium]|nr:PH domain-containing protein [Sphingobacteriales bacterium]